MSKPVLAKTYQLAQCNIGRAKASMDDAVMAGFAARLEDINALADGTPGFVWRLQTDEGNATSVQAFEDNLVLFNMSVWETPDQLRSFVYRSDHANVMRQRRSWFEKFDGIYLVLWWIPAGHIPTVEEAKQRLAHLQAHGESPHAFSFAQIHPSPDHATESPRVDLSDACPAL
ncbi:MAG TPA: DUF3291 domain-containing protein [Steroidobacteraceae bacterium]|jgi:hypothetical protein|nr:DUF3291 domain-containing protein [Steroidobacteraceae bacterium]